MPVMSKAQHLGAWHKQNFETIMYGTHGFLELLASPQPPSLRQLPPTEIPNAGPVMPSFVILS